MGISNKTLFILVLIELFIILLSASVFYFLYLSGSRTDSIPEGESEDLLEDPLKTLEEGFASKSELKDLELDLAEIYDLSKEDFLNLDPSEIDEAEIVHVPKE